MYNRLTDLPPNVIPLSAKEGLGVDMLKMLMDKILEQRKAYTDRVLVFELSKMNEVMSFLHAHGVVDQDTLTRILWKVFLEMFDQMVTFPGLPIFSLELFIAKLTNLLFKDVFEIMDWWPRNFTKSIQIY